MAYVALAIGSMLGGMLRYSVDFLFQRPDSFPFGTLLINLVGSFVLGVFYGIAEVRQMRAWFKVGFGAGTIGAFTTFSTFCMETEKLLASNLLLAVVYALISLIGGPVLAFVGDQVVLMISRRSIKTTEEFSA